MVRHVHVRACMSLQYRWWLLLFELRLGSSDLNWTELLHLLLVLTLLRKTKTLISPMIRNRSKLLKTLFYIIICWFTFWEYYYKRISLLLSRSYSDIKRFKCLLVDLPMYLVGGRPVKKLSIGVINIDIMHGCRFRLKQAAIKIRLITNQAQLKQLVY